MGGDPGYYICAPISHLWASYPIHVQLSVVTSRLEAKGRLANGKWTGIPTTATALTEWSTQTPILKYLCLIFDDIQSFVLDEHQSNTAMVYAGPSVPLHLQSTAAYPEAMLTVKAEAGKERNWADVVCPFESASHPGRIERVSALQVLVNHPDRANKSRSKVLWALERILLCDVRRCFSFGVDVAGAVFQVWFACRATLFSFSFDWLKDPDSLIRFFATLALSKDSELGIDTNIGAVDVYNSKFTFTINGAMYQTSKCLYDSGAKGVCGRGTRAFEAYIDGKATALVIKDCWLEDREDKALEHETVAKVRAAMGQEEFRGGFIDVCAHRVTRNVALDRVCEILQQGFSEQEGFYVVPLPWSRQPMEPKEPPRPRFRYQIVYEERGDSFYHITSLQKAYLDLNEVTKALYSLHTSKFVHGDVSPGNIIDAEGGVKISDLEFARERDADKLSELTLRTQNPPSPRLVEHLVGTRHFTAVEVRATIYMFLPHDCDYGDTTGNDTAQKLRDLLNRTSPDPRRVGRKVAPRRTFLYTPLHDYESVWWIATWVLFRCQPKSLNSEELDQLTQSRESSVLRIFDDKTDREHTILVPGVFLTLKGSLPRILHPLFEILEVFREELVRVYREYEESFDGSIILQNVESFHLCLEELAKVAAQIEIWDFPKTSTVDPSTIRLHLPQGAHLDEDTVNVLQGAPDGLIVPACQSDYVETTPNPLEKRKATGPLDPPAAKVRLHSEQRRA